MKKMTAGHPDLERKRRGRIHTLFIMSFLIMVSLKGYAENAPECDPGVARVLLRPSATKTYNRTNWIAQNVTVGNVTFTPSNTPCAGTWTTSVASFLSSSATGTTGNYQVAYTISYLTPSGTTKAYLSLFLYNTNGVASFGVWPDVTGDPHFFSLATDVYEFEAK